MPLLSQSLLDPRAYPHHPAAVELIQTHISWVFLTGSYVYKVKKPVNFGFLDYTTPQLRRYYCLREVELNRRLCPGIYLGVVPVTWERGRFTVEGPGEAVDYAVKMVEMPQERMMDLLLEQNLVTPSHLEEMAEVLVSFHALARTGGAVDGFGEPAVIGGNVEENFEQTRKHIGVAIAQDKYYELRQWSRNFLEENRELFALRIPLGKIRDGHGDLHSRNICLADQIYIYDCIEFNDRFRYGDVASEVAFLVMDLEFHRAGFLARAFLKKYLELTQDKGLLALLDFYKIYRAYVRGKIHGFLLQEEGVAPRERWYCQDRARRYFQLAYAYLRGYKRPLLIITSGLMGSGKSYWAHRLSQELGAPVIASDEVRKVLAGAHPQTPFGEPYGRGIYSPEFSRLTYQELLRRADYWLERQEAVILDASFSRNEDRQRAANLAQKRDADFYVLHCRASEAELIKRLQARLYRPEAAEEEGYAGASDGRPQLLSFQKQDFEALEDLPPGSVLNINTQEPEEKLLAAILQELTKKPLSVAGFL